MAKFPEDDYFSGTSMTFGEHLEELRGALVKALLALFLGFLVGLAVADQVVRFIQIPLERALAKYYLDLELDRVAAEYGPEAAVEMRGFVAKNQFVRQNELVFGYQYLELGEVRRLVQRYDQLAGARESRGERTGEAAAEDVPKIHVPDVSDNRFLRIRTWVRKPYSSSALKAEEVFMIWLKAAFIAGVVLSSPVSFYFIWNFVAAGLYPHEQRYVYIYLPFSILLFLLGASMAFFFVFDPVLDFLFGFNRWMNINPEPRISEWLGFVLFLPLGFGVAFQLPLVMLFVNRIGVIELAVFTDKWRLAVLAIFVLSMILTPADPVSMLLMAVPLTVLYFLGILLCLWMPRQRNPFAEAQR